MEKFFTPERFVGKAAEEDKGKLAEKKKEIFHSQQFEDLQGIETEKSPEILQAINFANRVTNELRRKYGLEDMDVPAQNIHLIKRAAKSVSPLSFAEGKFQEQNLRILIAEKDFIPEFTRNLTHEMLHMKSLHSFDVDDEKEHKAGLTIKSRSEKHKGMTYFSVLDEAMTEAITKRAVLGAVAENDSIFKGLAESTQKAFAKYPEVTDLAGDLIFNDHLFCAEENRESLFDKFLNKLLREESRPVYACHFSYQREQDILNSLIDKIFERNNDRFADKEDIYLLFEKSYITGNMFQLGILIDRTFGSGTFRKLGELTFGINERQEQKDFLEVL